MFLWQTKLFNKQKKQSRPIHLFIYNLFILTTDKKQKKIHSKNRLAITIVFVKLVKINLVMEETKYDGYISDKRNRAYIFESILKN